LCHELGVVIEFLPPYSPDFNPIEEAFAELKAWMKKHYLLQEGYTEFEGFLNAAIKSMAHKAGNHFRSCHIIM
jgi:transposase